MYKPWAILSGNNIFWIGLAESEESAWDIALGWPSPQEIKYKKSIGFKAVTPSVSWHNDEDHDETNSVILKKRSS